MQQAPSAKTLEQIRTNARRRLIGAIILVVLAIAILPWVLETKPRESETQVQVNTTAMTTPPAHVTTTPPPLPVAIPPVDSAPVVMPPPDMTVSVPPATVESNNPFFVVEGTTEGQTLEPGITLSGTELGEGAPAQRTSEGYAIRPSGRLVIASKLKPGETAPASSLVSDAARAAALLGEPLPAATRPPATTGGTQTASAAQKFVIQVGAYSDVTKVNEVRAKLTMAGYSSYTEEANTNAGRVTRVRIGPVNGRASADEMAKKIGALGLPVSILPA